MPGQTPSLASFTLRGTALDVIKAVAFASCHTPAALALRDRVTALQTCYACSMPGYYNQDCHYFYRTSLRGLSIATLVSPLHS